MRGTCVSSVRIYLYSNCSSCKKADAALAEAGLDVERRDIFKHKLSADEVKRVLADIGKSAHDVLSTRSIPYRELSLAHRVVSEAELIELMAQYPGLLKRPIVIGGGKSLVGFNKGAIADLVAAVKQGQGQ